MKMGAYRESEGLLTLIQNPLHCSLKEGLASSHLGLNYHHIQFPRYIFHKDLFPTEPERLAGVPGNNRF